ncbi:hypothetical protein D3C71_1913090 [compost metagenome]
MPAASPGHSTTADIWQPAAGSVAPVSVSEPEPAVAVNVPPVQVCEALTSLSGAGNASLMLTAGMGAPKPGFLMVIVSAACPPGVTAEGAKALLILGASAM